MAESEGSEMSGDRVKIFNNVYVKNLPADVDDEELHEMFKIFGRILSAKVLKSYDGKRRGCGFVSFMEPESAAKAVKEMNGKKVNGEVLYAAYAQNKAERQAELKKEFEQNNIDSASRYQGLNLYVKNLDDVIDDEWLRKEFSQFGKITSAKVMTENGKSKGFGFVCFSSTEEATKAMTVMNGRIIVKKPLYVALAQRKEDRKAHLATQYMQRVVTMRMQMEQMFSAGGAGYYVPTMPEGAQQSFFTPQNIPQMGAGLSWHTVGPNQLVSESGHQNMLAGPQVRPAGPPAPVQTSMHPSVSMSALTGQNASQPWSTMPVMPNNVSGHPLTLSVASPQTFPYSVNMFTMNGQNNTQPWVTMPLTQNNLSGHPVAANVTSQQGYPYKISQPILNMREADADNLHRPVISPSPPQRPLSIPPWSLSSSPRSLSPSPIPFMRFLAPPPRLPADYLRPRIPMAQPVSSGMPRHTEPFNSPRTTLNVKSNFQ